MPHKRKGRKKLRRPNPVTPRLSSDKAPADRPEGKSGVSRIRTMVQEWQEGHSAETTGEPGAGFVFETIAIVLDCRSYQRSQWLPVLRTLRKACSLVRYYPDPDKDERPYVRTLDGTPTAGYTITAPVSRDRKNGLLSQLLHILQLLPVDVLVSTHLNSPSHIMKGSGAGDKPVRSRNNFDHMPGDEKARLRRRGFDPTKHTDAESGAEMNTQVHFAGPKGKASPVTSAADYAADRMPSHRVPVLPVPIPEGYDAATELRGRAEDTADYRAAKLGYQWDGAGI